jgi:phthiocerol/phenolphthiocerol synthesis type-I polyketide synthase D
LLGGFCAGGFVAFEMAQQLRGAGEQVDALVTIEQGFAHADTKIARGLIALWGKLTRRDPEQQLTLFIRLRRYTMERSMGDRTPDWLRTDSGTHPGRRGPLKRLLGVFQTDSLRTQAVSPTNADDAGYARSRRTFELECRYMWAISGYTPRRYDGRIAMFCASDEQIDPIDDLTRRWRRIAPAIDVRSTPGTHFSSITTHAEALAERVHAWLDAGEKDR